MLGSWWFEHAEGCLPGLDLTSRSRRLSGARWEKRIWRQHRFGVMEPRNCHGVGTGVLKSGLCLYRDVQVDSGTHWSAFHKSFGTLLEAAKFLNSFPFTYQGVWSSQFSTTVLQLREATLPRVDPLPGSAPGSECNCIQIRHLKPPSMSSSYGSFRF